MGGYIFGNIFKGPKLTKISPNKTFAGAIGGFFSSIAFTFLILSYVSFFNKFNLIFDLKFISYILFISLVSQIGDLIVSYFKRLSKIKDTGKLIPGHGGILDRIDGMIFAFPAVYLLNL
jgi:phosphatidate cytidylyltransferase